MSQVGGRVRGRVQVDVFEETRCSRLWVEQRWRTSGQGDVANGGMKTSHLFTGNWVPGRYTYPFELAANGPPTYHGHLFNLDWYVTARAYLPRLSNPVVSERYDVMPAPVRHGGQGFIDDVDAARSPHWLARIAAFAGHAIQLLLLILVSLFLLAFALAIFQWLLFPVIVILLAIGGYLLVGKLSWRMRAGRVRLHVGATTVPRGGRLACTVRFPANATQLPPIVMLSLCAQEEVWGGGNEREHYEHVLLSEHEVLDTPVRSSAGIAFQAELQIPEDAPTSLSVEDHILRWYVEAEAQLSPAARWKQRQDFTVR